MMIWILDWNTCCEDDLHKDTEYFSNKEKLKERIEELKEQYEGFEELEYSISKGERCSKCGNVGIKAKG